MLPDSQPQVHVISGLLAILGLSGDIMCAGTIWNAQVCADTAGVGPDRVKYKTKKSIWRSGRECLYFPSARRPIISDGMVGFSQFYFSSLGEADFATTELSPAADGLLFVGDVRLDNRQELHKKNEVMILRALEVNACRFSPLAMKAVSVMRE
jgi:hypothetical protein